MIQRECFITELVLLHIVNIRDESQYTKLKSRNVEVSKSQKGPTLKFSSKTHFLMTVSTL